MQFFKAISINIFYKQLIPYLRMESNNGIRKEVSKSALTVSRVYSSDYQKAGTKTAELRQSITTKSFYPGMSVSNDLQDNVFDAVEDFGAEEEDYENIENRVAWIDVPENASKEQVEARLSEAEGACLYKILSNKPILTSQQQYAIDNPELNVNMDTFANSQVVRYPEGNSKAGQIVTDPNGKVQYRAVFFSKSEKADIDNRTPETDDFYASPEIRAEISQSQHVVAGQEL